MIGVGYIRTSVISPPLEIKIPAADDNPGLLHNIRDNGNNNAAPVLSGDGCREFTPDISPGLRAQRNRST